MIRDFTEKFPIFVHKYGRLHKVRQSTDFNLAVRVNYEIFSEFFATPLELCRFQDDYDLCQENATCKSGYYLIVLGNFFNETEKKKLDIEYKFLTKCPTVSKAMKNISIIKILYECCGQV